MTEWVYLLEATPFDPVAHAEVPVRLASGGPQVHDGVLYPARLEVVLNTQVDLWTGEFGSGLPQFGTISILAGDEAMDYLTGYMWDGRSVVVKRGPAGGDYAEFETVFDGTALGLSFDEDRIVIHLRDYSETLAIPIQQNLYGGIGGAEGGIDLQDAVKPLAYGRILNAEPVLLDEALQIYQLNDGPMEAVDGVFDRGVALTASGVNYTSYAALAGATIPEGQFATCLALGLFRLGAPPVSPVTVDFRGSNSGGYVNTTSTIIQRIVTTRGGLTAADLDTASFAALESDQPGEIGIYITGETSIAQVLDELLAPIGAWWTFTNHRKLKVGRLEFTASTTTLTPADLVEIRRDEPPLPYWRRKFGYARNWRPMSRGEINMPTADLSGLGDLAYQDEVNWLTQVSGPGKPADGATSDLALVARGNCQLLGNTITKPTGVAAWDSDVYSLDAMRGSAFVSFQPGTIGTFMVGLNADPTTDGSYTSLDFAWYITPTDVQIRAPGNTTRHTGPVASLDDVFAIYYDGSAANFFRNGDLVLSLPTSPNLKLYFDCSVNAVGSVVKHVRFLHSGSNYWGDISGPGKPQDGATVGAPPGTNVGSTPAEDVEQGSNAANNGLNPDGSVKPGKVGTDALADAAITTAKLADLAVDVNKLADLAVTASKLAGGAVTGPKLADNAVTASKLAEAAVTTSKIANGAVDSQRLANLAVEASKLADGAVTTTKIASAAVGSAAIAEGAIGTVHIGTAAILRGHIKDGEIVSAKIGTGQIDTAHIKNGAIGSAAIANLAVGTGHIANGAITNLKVANGAIQTAHIQDLAVGTLKIADNAVTLPVSVYSSGLNNIIRTSNPAIWVDLVVTPTINTGGAPLFLVGSCHFMSLEAASFATFRIVRRTGVTDTAILTGGSVGVATNPVVITIPTSHTPPSGNYTYVFQGQRGSGEPGVSRISLFALVTKK